MTPLLDRLPGDVDDLDLNLNLRDFDEMDADDAAFTAIHREAVLGLPARPGTRR
jgi:hypothetical protein